MPDELGRPWAGRIAPIALAVGLFAAAPSAAELDLALMAGVFNVSQSERAAEAGFEVRYPLDAWGLEAAGGLAASGDSAVWSWLGVRRDFAIGPRWLIAPGFALSLYEKGSGGKDLGGTLQFRSSLEASYLVGRTVRVGAAFYHLSNAGLDDVNPGSNSLVATVRFPVGR